MTKDKRSWQEKEKWVNICEVRLFTITVNNCTVLLFTYLQDDHDEEEEEEEEKVKSYFCLDYQMSSLYILEDRISIDLSGLKSLVAKSTERIAWCHLTSDI